jgi:hypothetical protein
MVEKGLPGFAVEAIRSYAGERRRPVLWRGMLRFTYLDDPIFEVEATLLESKNAGERPYIAWPQRTYESGGEKKYKSIFWMTSSPMHAAAGEAAAFEAGLLTDDEYASRRESGKADSNGSSKDYEYDPLDDVERT